MAIPPHMHPFVLDVAPAHRRRIGAIDVHSTDPSAERRRPAVVFVHGGPVPAQLEPTPRDWPTFLGYGALAAAHGLVGVTVDHGLHGPGDYPVAGRNVRSAVEQARAVEGVDPDRVGLWFFSGGGPLAAGWLAAVPPWLRCVALSYPFLSVPPGVPDGAEFDAVGAVATPGRPPILLTRVGAEFPVAVPGQNAFVDAARAHGVPIEVIDVPNGQHGFDSLDHTDESRTAVTRAMTWVAATLHARGAVGASGR
ncbi:alpha/beta hydrolase [Frankia sp. Ag45/Mut15]|uniref:Alpha/beta hydrolase n=1 Tax=Frankia umida TaxID=573489 RepID=A0ABT0K3N4_9ACTN|nr:alpha/beta hydrolase [Frankia umida]MCK9878112.1 alpha/beta hydrolase [Frankia umida]